MITFELKTYSRHLDVFHDVANRFEILSRIIGHDSIKNTDYDYHCCYKSPVKMSRTEHFST